MGDISDCIQQLSSSTEFKKALKVLIKYEINCLLKRLSDTGEEAFVITTSIDDGVQGHLGTVKGEGFLQAENTGQTLKEKFIQFCTDSGVLRDMNGVYGRDSPVDFSQKISFLPARISCERPPVESSEVDVCEQGGETSQNDGDTFSWSSKKKFEEYEKTETDTEKSHQGLYNLQKEDFDNIKLKKESLEQEYQTDKETGLNRHCKINDKTSQHIEKVDKLGPETFHSKLYKAKQHPAWKMLDEFPHFSYHGKNDSPNDMEYLNQCYFRGMTNECEGELLDFSIKKESHSKPKSCDHSTFHTESGSHTDNVYNRHDMHDQDLSNSASYRAHDRAYITDRHVTNKNSWTSSIPEIREHGETSFNNKNWTECTGTSKPDIDSGEVFNIKTEPPEAMNLSVEPVSATVKLEPGTSCQKYTDQSPQRDRKTHKIMSSGYNPPLTMHLNFNCKICGQVFKNRQYRDFHVKAHGSSCQYFCSLCSKGFHSETDYKKHINEHTEPVFQCETCGYHCTREFRMRAHKEICGSPNKVYKCPFCHKQFAAQRYMRIHIKSHDAHNIHTCPICQNTYPLKNSLLKHMKKKHGQVQN